MVRHGASPELIQKWLEQARHQGATHVITAVDRGEWVEYPVKVMRPETPDQTIARLKEDELTEIVEVYDLKQKFAKQLSRVRCLEKV